MNVIREYQAKRWGRIVWLVDVKCPECLTVFIRPRYCKHRKCANCVKPNLKHGRAKDGSYDITYHSWENMRSRCRNPNNPYYSKYGGAGISVCEEWDNFENFLRDMGNRPSLECTLDRIDNKKGYFKKNCRWATRKQQQRNRSVTRYIRFKGRKMSVSQFIEETGCETTWYHLKQGRTPEWIAAHYRPQKN